VAGHYLFLTNALMIKHRKRKQRIGTGFIDSRNALFRELNRGVDWIFSNKAVAMQRLCNALARRSMKRLA
jgi:glycerophosphoryl diester phosphodiesterase